MKGRVTLWEEFWFCPVTVSSPLWFLGGSLLDRCGAGMDRVHLVAPNRLL